MWPRIYTVFVIKTELSVYLNEHLSFPNSTEQYLSSQIKCPQQEIVLLDSDNTDVVVRRRILRKFTISRYSHLTLTSYLL